MVRMLIAGAMLALAACSQQAVDGAVSTDDALSLITQERIHAHLAYLASDDLEGRLTGQPGHELAARYVAEQLASFGVEPGGTDGSARDLQDLFNPLLFAQDIVPVPCRVNSERFETTTIITGPNSGGKTRLLQALGLTQLLGQGGFFVPAAAARLPVASGLYLARLDYEASGGKTIKTLTLAVEK